MPELFTASLAISAATVEDRPALCRLLRAAGGEAEGIERAVELALAPRSSAWLLVARRVGVTVGMALANPIVDRAGGRLLVEELFVEPPFRRRGVGRALLDHLAREARRYGLVAVDVVTVDEAAAAFVAAVGFLRRRGEISRKQLSGPHPDNDGMVKP